MKNGLRIWTCLLVVSLFSALQTQGRQEPQQTNWGNVYDSTSTAYKEAALKVFLQDANRVAADLGLPETLPLQTKDLTEAIIDPPLMADGMGMFGAIRSKSFQYSAIEGCKISSITRIFPGGNAARDREFERLDQQFVLSKKFMDTNAAYRLAVQWLLKLSVDVPALERDSKVNIMTRHVGNRFIPRYWVNWDQRETTYQEGILKKEDTEATASVQLFLPDRSLRYLAITKPQYILSRRLSVPDREKFVAETDDPFLRKVWTTTPAYKKGALEVMINAVNQLSAALKLREKTPIQESNLTEIKIESPFVSDEKKNFATVCTSNYVYGAYVGNKLSAIRINSQTSHRK